MLNFLFNHTPIFYFIQSLWRDEAYSVLIAERPLSFFLTKLNFETPFYYILLHFWIKIFGESEIAVRSLSFVGFTLAVVVIIFWAEYLFKKHWLSWALPIFFFFNPMLLYYAFEVRAYGWYMFFATLSLYAYSTKKWKLLTIANILAFYFHTYAILIPCVQFVHFLFEKFWIEKKIKIKEVIKNPLLISLSVSGLFILPWFYFLLEEAKRMRPTWYFPVDAHLVKSVLGNMFIGYEGTPGGLWGITALLSLALLAFFIFAQRNKEQKRDAGYLLSVILLPLIIVIGVSFKKPLFVIRYLIPVTIAEVVLLTITIKTIKNSVLQKISAILFFLFILSINVYLPQKKAKLDIRTTVYEANAIRRPEDKLYVTSPLIFFESVYYTKDRQNVFLYNPHNSPFPWYVGESAFSVSQMASALPSYPSRAVIIDENRSVTVSYQIQTATVPQSKEK
jgi:mannosyltransferase